MYSNWSNWLCVCMNKDVLQQLVELFTLLWLLEERECTLLTLLNIVSYVYPLSQLISSVHLIKALLSSAFWYSAARQINNIINIVKWPPQSFVHCVMPMSPEWMISLKSYCLVGKWVSQLTCMWTMVWHNTMSLHVNVFFIMCQIGISFCGPVVLTILWPHYCTTLIESYSPAIKLKAPLSTSMTSYHKS